MPAFEPGYLFDYSVYTASGSDEMVRLLGKVFTQGDPPAVAARLTASEFEAFVRLLCPKAEADGLTIVARSRETGEMIGVLLTEDSASEPPQGMDRLSAKFNPIFDMLDQLGVAYRDGRTVRAGESLHLFLLGVAQQFTGQGVAHQLVTNCVANGLRKGYRVAVTEATNRTSQHIFRKLGFVERARLLYRNYRFDGQAVFASIAEHGGTIQMDKLLEP
jgi:ribosomal protein S18 acetylase RimI-like enzyme